MADATVIIPLLRLSVSGPGSWMVGLQYLSADVVVVTVREQEIAEAAGAGLIPEREQAGRRRVSVEGRRPLRFPKAGVFILACVMCGSVFGQEGADVEELRKENTELRRRLEALEADMKELGVRLDRLPEAARAAKPAMRSKYQVDLYGFIKLDAAYDTSRTSTGNFARWVLPEGVNNNDDQFNMTANQSRFGLKFQGPEAPGMRTSGKVEVDFYGGGPENKAHLMMRHAYLQVDWPESDFSILAGQTSDVVSPLVPSTLNYTVGWWAGNPGYRRPQLRLTKGFEVGENSRLLLQGALARTIGDTTAVSHPGDTGEDAGFPSLQGRAALTFPLLTDKKTTVGISGVWGREEYDIDAMDNSEDMDVWMANLDLTIPITDKVAFKGEVWTGANLDAYLAGIGQGVNATTIDEIGAKGGWGALSFGPYGKWRFNVGAGIDDPHDGDLNTGDRERNTSVFANTIFDINEAVQCGFEVSRWETDYKDEEDGDSLRFQMSFIYKF